MPTKSDIQTAASLLGSIKTAKKAEASRRNGAKSKGRPPKKAKK